MRAPGALGATLVALFAHIEDPDVMKPRVHPKYKAVIGGRLRARSLKGQEAEATVAC